MQSVGTREAPDANTGTPNPPMLLTTSNPRRRMPKYCSRQEHP